MLILLDRLSQELMFALSRGRGLRFGMAMERSCSLGGGGKVKGVKSEFNLTHGSVEHEYEH